MMAIMLEYIGFNNIRVHMGIFHRSLVNGQRSEESDPGFVPFFEQKNSRTFQDFQRLYSVQKRALSLVFFSSSTTWAISSWRSFCACSFYAIENLGWIKLAPTAIFKDFQGISRCMWIPQIMLPESGITDGRHQDKIYRLHRQALFFIAPLHWEPVCRILFTYSLIHVLLAVTVGHSEDTDASSGWGLEKSTK